MDRRPPRGVADPYADLIAKLPMRKRRALVYRLTHGYYEGWRPSRLEIADLVAVELGQISALQFDERQRQRRMRRPPMGEFAGMI